jgi:hypothetical protein
MNKYSEYLNNEISFSEFLSSLSLVKPELGETYKQASGSWSEKHYKIIYLNDDIAVGVSVFNKISNKFIGDYSLFNAKTGFTYSDARPEYRLEEKLK